MSCQPDETSGQHNPSRVNASNKPVMDTQTKKELGERLRSIKDYCDITMYRKNILTIRDLMEMRQISKKEAMDLVNTEVILKKKKGRGRPRKIKT